MSTATHEVAIPRIDVSKYDDAMRAERKQLLGKAAQTLGYRPGDPKSLLNQLLDMGIVPFKAASVRMYMDSKKRTSMYSGTRAFILWVVATVLGIAGTLTAFHYADWAGKSPVGIFNVLTIAGGIACVVSLFGLAVGGGDVVGHGNRTLWAWRSHTISGYEGVIPDHVLNKAMQIKAAIPNASFDVYSLDMSTERNMRPVRDPDPFFSVRLDREAYYIEQWDERDLPHIDI